jgi:uncharacterized protein YutE (UPF0331/DUF86 family)
VTKGRTGQTEICASGRNLLVHGYAEIDDLQVWHSLERLDDLRAFAAAAVAAADR